MKGKDFHLRKRMARGLTLFSGGSKMRVCVWGGGAGVVVHALHPSLRSHSTSQCTADATAAAGSGPVPGLVYC